MATHISAGGSSNIIIDGSASVVWDLTGLDNSGRVLTEINVKMVAGGSPVSLITLQLPSIQSLNGRIVLFRLNLNDFAGDITIVPASGDTINSETIPFPLQNPKKLKVYPVQVGSSNNWVLPLLASTPA
jgi:hypothetical protein